MKTKSNDHINSTSDEALLNEYKGYLFEYLVAYMLSKHYGIESQFLGQLSKDYKNTLSEYEIKLNSLAPSLVKPLQIQSKSLASELVNGTDEYLPKKMDNIWVIGKANCQLELGSWNEADILMKYGEEIFPVSIKLCKVSSYINTKSAGISSFISKYFSEYNDSILIQNKLELLVNFNFHTMRKELYEEVGLEDDESFKRWRLSGFPELTGKLPDHLRLIVRDSYKALNDFLYNALKSFFLKDQELFFKCLGPLLGLSGEDMIQAILFRAQNEDYAKQVEKHILIHKLKDSLLEKDSLSFRKPSEAKGYFYIDFKSFSLQIRVKPMNKFTAKSYKINCSIKYHNK